AGLELAGTVDAIGPGAKWQVGDRVAAMTKSIPDGRGAQAELAVVHSDSAAPVPDGMDLVEAATMPMNGLTVRLALDRLALSAGEPERGIEIELVSVRQYLRESKKLRALMQLAADEKLTPRIAETFPPERAAEAHAKLEAGGVRGRLVLVF